MQIDLDENEAKLATQACERWSAEIMDTLTGPKSISYSGIAREDMSKTASALRMLAWKIGQANARED